MVLPSRASRARAPLKFELKMAGKERFRDEAMFLVLLHVLFPGEWGGMAGALPSLSAAKYICWMWPLRYSSFVVL